MARQGRTTGKVTYGRLIFTALPPPDPMPVLLKCWANRMKPMCYSTVTRVVRNRLIPGALQLVDNVIPVYRNRHREAVRQYRSYSHAVVQTQTVPYPVPIQRVRARAFPNPFTRIVRSHVLALGPAAFVPIKGKTVRHFRPSTPHIVRRVLPYQLFVPVPGPRKAWVAPPYVRVRTRPYPIQPPCVFVTKGRVRPSMTYYANRQRTVPVNVIGPPIFLNRVRQLAAAVIHRKQHCAIPFNTPSAPFPVHAVRQFARPAYYRKAVRFIPGSRQDIVVPFIRKRNVVSQSLIAFRHTSVIAGPVTTVVAPFFLPRRPQQMTRYYPVRIRPEIISTQAVLVVARKRIVNSGSPTHYRSTAVIPGPTVTVVAPFFLPRRPQQMRTYYPIRQRAEVVSTQAVLVVNRKRIVPPVVWPRKARTPFYVNVNVAVPTPFPFFKHLPRAYHVSYPKRHPVAAVALPPPNVQNVIVTSKRTVR